VVTIAAKELPANGSAPLAIEVDRATLTAAELIRGRGGGGGGPGGGPDVAARAARDGVPEGTDLPALERRALAAFRRCQVVLIVDGRQVEDEDELVELSAGSNVTFLRLVPLAGG
jgi:hypothetical protein